MATPNLKPQSATPQGKIEIVDVGPKITWPKNERIPRSITEALALGWNVTHTQATEIDGERSERGTAHLRKRAGTRCLTLEIPYIATFTHGRPHSPVARSGKTRYVTTEQLRARLGARS
jgi:hypothetical protein